MNKVINRIILSKKDINDMTFEERVFISRETQGQAYKRSMLELELAEKKLMTTNPEQLTNNIMSLARPLIDKFSQINEDSKTTVFGKAKSTPIEEWSILYKQHLSELSQIANSLSIYIDALPISQKTKSYVKHFEKYYKWAKNKDGWFIPKNNGT